MVRSMMSRATLPISFWGYALETAVHILNLVPTKKVSKTPFEIWKGKRPSLRHIKIWGCEVYVRLVAQDKLEARSKKYLFVGYTKESFGFSFYRPKDNVVFVARRGVFLEREIISKEDSGKDKISDSTLSELDESANYKEAMTSHKAAKWKEAIKSEIQSMYDNQVWNLVDTTPGLKMVGCKWIFKKKTDIDGKVHTYKARLVAKGYTQTHGIDYEETFSPVAKIKSIRIMLAIAAFHDYEIWKMDVKTTFVNEKLIEDVFMAQPEGFENAKDRSKRLIGLSQDTYLNKILKRFKIENSKKGNLPLHHGIKISKDLCLKTDEELDRMSRVPYASVVGSIMYAMKCTRPDVSFTLSMASQHQQNPGEAVTWKSSKQDTVADSSCEFEYITACKASNEVIYMKNFIGDLGVVPTVQDPIKIFYDNENAVALTKEPKDHRKSKHIERKYHFVRSKVEEGHSLAVALDGTLCLVKQDRLRPIIVDDLSKWETVGFSVQKILGIPYKGQCVFTTEWSLDALSVYQESSGPYHIDLPTPDEDHLPACLAHMLYCIVTKKPYNLAYFVAKRIEFIRNQPKLNLPFGMSLTRLFNHDMGMYPHLVGDQYVIVDRVMLPLVVEQPRKVRKDVGIKRSHHSNSSSSTFHHGSSSHQNDDDNEKLRDECTSRNSTPSPRSYYNSLSPIRPQIFVDPPSNQQTMPTLFTIQTSILNRQETMHVEQRGMLKSMGKAFMKLLSRKK
ncbi:retrotransposon protein, putative, ty1-copia subclass [Tanacetum coccineum]|uniref:Retrotransposon protein, putative, ty1-copia subclass n=1 Tax=Tanacetum coccineum TaxID=301880 RepID=A0ABQ4XZA4_9ASTR